MEHHQTDLEDFKDASMQVASFLLIGSALTVASVAALVGCLAASLAHAGYKLIGYPSGKEEDGLQWLKLAPLSLLKSHWDICFSSSQQSSGDGSKIDGDVSEGLKSDSGNIGEPKSSEEHLNQYVSELLDKNDEPTKGSDAWQDMEK